MKRLKRLAAMLALFFATTALAPIDVQAGGRGGRGGSSRSYTPRSYSPRAGSSRGYYVGPRQPAGTYRNGMGSSHKGGTYKNPYTGDRYQKRS